MTPYFKTRKITRQVRAVVSMALYTLASWPHGTFTSLAKYACSMHTWGIISSAYTCILFVKSSACVNIYTIVYCSRVYAHLVYCTIVYATAACERKQAHIQTCANAIHAVRSHEFVHIWLYKQAHMCAPATQAHIRVHHARGRR